MYKKLARKYKGISDGQIDEKISSYRAGTESDLIHPLTLSETQLQEIIPNILDASEIKKQLTVKQKDIAHRVNISKLPSDRPPGFIGQAALFEVLSEMSCDFSFVLDNELLTEKFLFFKLLALSQFSAELLGYGENQVSVDAYFEPWDEGRRSDRQIKIWRDRILTIYFYRVQQQFDFYRNADVREIIEQSLKLKDKRGLTVSRIVEWLNCPKSKAKEMHKIFRSFSLVHRIFQMNLPKTGLVRTIQEYEKIPANVNIEFWFRGKNVQTDTTSFLVGILDWKTESNSNAMELEAGRLSFDNYDKDRLRLNHPQTTSPNKTTRDLNELFTFSNLTYIDRSVKLSDRDLFYLGVSRFASFNALTYDELSKILEINISDIEDGFRNIFRKQLIRSIFKSNSSALGDLIVIKVQGSDLAIVSFVGQIVQMAPTSSFRVSRDFSYGYLWHNLPKYLTEDFIEQVQKKAIENDVLVSIYKITKFRPYHLSSIMSLMDDH
ncbi:MAG: hypothetical protein ACTSWQ_04925 [Candidatus Thorarchaeota archaeon]